MAKKETKKESTKQTPAEKTDSKVLDAMREIKTKFGDDSIMMLGDKPHVDINSIPTGSIGLEAALGIGGVPRGRII